MKAVTKTKSVPFAFAKLTPPPEVWAGTARVDIVSLSEVRLRQNNNEDRTGDGRERAVHILVRS